MSGHSKWHSIKHKKGAADAKRGKLFAVLIRQIEVAARAGGGDVESNATLRTMIGKARDNSVPLDTIQRAIKRGTGEEEGVIYEQVSYEGYAPGGVAVIVQALTDNRNRTASEIRNIFTKADGALGASVGWLFEKKGVITMKNAVASEDEVLTKAVDAGAEDMKVTSDEYEITVAPEEFAKVKQALEAAGYALTSAEITLVPKSTVSVEGKEAQRVIRLLEALEDHDDVQHVYANFDIPDEVLEQVG